MTQPFDFSVDVDDTGHGSDAEQATKQVAEGGVGEFAKSPANGDGVVAVEGTAVEDGIPSFELGDDVYSLLFAYPFLTTINAYTIFALFFQAFLTLLLYYDLLKNYQEKNLLSVPVSVDTPVRIAQAMCLPLAFMAHSDCTDALNNIGAKYDPRVMKDFPDATRFSWIYTSLLRFLMGFLLVLVSFIQIVQAESVTEMILNVDAVSFIGQIDNHAFWLANNNFISENFRKKCDRVTRITFRLTKGKRSTMAKRLVTLFTLGSLIVGYSFVLIKSNRDIYLEASACSRFSVSFGEKTLYLDPSRIKVSNTIRDSAKVVSSPNTKIEMLYSSFNGIYRIVKDNHGNVLTKHGWPSYVEDLTGLPDHIDDSQGIFKYCNGRWYFYIPSLSEAIIGRETKNHQVNDCGQWLLRSPETDARTLERVGPSGWKIWTGKVEDASELSVSCEACSSEIDCNFHGVCNQEDGRCECIGNYFGEDCALDPPCLALEALNVGETSWDYSKFLGDFVLLGKDGKTFGASGKEDDFLLIYGSPAYVTQLNDTAAIYFYYIGSRWVYEAWDVDEFQKEFSTKAAPPHTFWDVLMSRSRGHSAPTPRTGSPFGLQWYYAGGSQSRGIFGPFLYAWSAKAEGRCLYESCEDLCGKFGSCIDGACKCTACYAGNYCEHAPYEDYAWNQFVTWVKDGNSSRVLESQFYQRYWSGKDPFTECPDVAHAALEYQGDNDTRRRLRPFNLST